MKFKPSSPPISSCTSTTPNNNTTDPSAPPSLSLPILIAKTALEHYRTQLPSSKGKPQPGREWTVYAAIVATATDPHHNYASIATKDRTSSQSSSSSPSLRAWVVSCATGSKCIAIQNAEAILAPAVVPPCCPTPITSSCNIANTAGIGAAVSSNSINDSSSSSSRSSSSSSTECRCNAICCSKQVRGMVLHDSHAEVLARRGLLQVFWQEVEFGLSQWKKEKNSSSSDGVEECSMDDRSNSRSNNRGNEAAKDWDDSKALLDMKIRNLDGARGGSDGAGAGAGDDPPVNRTTSSISSSTTTCAAADETKGENAEPPSSSSSSSLLPISFLLKPNIQLHLYVSDSPCGDASIYEISPQYDKQQYHPKIEPPQQQLQNEPVGGTTHTTTTTTTTTTPIIGETRGQQGSNEHLDPPRNSGDNSDNAKSLNFTGAKLVVSTQTGMSLHTTITTKYDHSCTEENYTRRGDEKQSQVSNCLLPPVVIEKSSINNNINNNNNHPETVSTCGGFTIARERRQRTAALRLKSSRSNIPEHLRSTSMSCSDKICRWVVLGLQGSGLLCLFLPEAIGLASVVVSRDPRVRSLGEDSIVADAEMDGQKDALERAIVTRAKEVRDGLRAVNVITPDYDNDKSAVLPTVFIVDEMFLQGKNFTEKESVDQKIICSTPVDQVCTVIKKKDHVVSSKKRKLIGERVPQKRSRQKQKNSPCGISLNWQQLSHTSGDNKKVGKKNVDTQLEITVGAKGIKQGKVPKNSQDIIKGSSRLCRWALLKQSLKAFAFVEEYQESGLHHIKRTLVALRNGEISYQRAKSVLAAKGTKSCTMIFSEIKDIPLFGWVRSCEEGDFFYHCSNLKK